MDVDPISIQAYVKPAYELDYLTSVRTRGILHVFYISSRTVAASRLSLGGAMFASTGSHCNCLDLIVPEIRRSAIQQWKKPEPTKQYVMFQR
jgi:hypothetical protein